MKYYYLQGERDAAAGRAPCRARKMGVRRRRGGGAPFVRRAGAESENSRGRWVGLVWREETESHWGTPERRTGRPFRAVYADADDAWGVRRAGPPCQCEWRGARGGKPAAAATVVLTDTFCGLWVGPCFVRIRSGQYNFLFLAFFREEVTTTPNGMSVRPTDSTGYVLPWPLG